MGHQIDITRAAWYEKHLFLEQWWHPETLGDEKVIYQVRTNRSMVSLHLEPIPAAPPGDSAGRVAILFECLGSIAKEHDAAVLFSSYSDGAVVEVLGEGPFDESTWNSDLLFQFERAVLDGGPLHLTLSFLDARSVVVFQRYDGFQISFFGDDSLWQEIAGRLSSAGFPVGWTFSDV
jgi:hypothetical protein